MNKLLTTIGLDALSLAKTFGVTFVGTIALGWSGVVASLNGGHASSMKDLLVALVLSGASAGAHAVLQVAESRFNKTSSTTTTPTPPATK